VRFERLFFVPNEACNQVTPHTRKNGSQGWSRSNDIRVNSSALYQLSYLGFENWCVWRATIPQLTR
jgi:hypothetical protein